MTLVEIMFAIALSSIAVVTLVVLFSFIFSSARNGKSQAKATSIAQRYMERLKADQKFYDRVKASPGFIERELVWEGVQTAPVEYTVKIGLDPTGTAGHFVDGLVTVSWTERAVAKQVALETFFPSW